MNAKFVSVALNVEQQSLVDRYRIEFEGLAYSLDHNLVPGRYLSLAITALEEAAMWVNKSISHDGWYPFDPDAVGKP